MLTNHKDVGWARAIQKTAFYIVGRQPWVEGCNKVLCPIWNDTENAKKKIEDATGMQTVCRSLIYKWHKRLWYGQEEIDDDQILDFVKFIELYIKHQLTG